MIYASVISAVAAVVLAGAALRLLWTQTSTLDAQRRVAWDQQAHRVIGFIADRPANELRWLRTTNGTASRLVAVRNGGDEPIYALTLNQLIIELDRPLGPHQTAGVNLGSLMPGEVGSVAIECNEGISDTPFRIAFMDSRGRHWLRNEYGVLTRIDWPGQRGGVIAVDSRPRWKKRLQGPVVQRGDRPSALY